MPAQGLLLGSASTAAAAGLPPSWHDLRSCCAAVTLHAARWRSAAARCKHKCAASIAHNLQQSALPLTILCNNAAEPAGEGPMHTHRAARHLAASTVLARAAHVCGLPPRTWHPLAGRIAAAHLKGSHQACRKHG